MSNAVAYGILVFGLDFIMGVLVMIYFWIKLPTQKPIKSQKEYDLFNNYDIIKYQKKEIRILKIRLFFIKLFHIKRKKQKC